ncbi:MAG: hypothetical protein KBC42_02625 [Candidatus Pacebacteria bacterium]|nr:hypothetical protein [Candidatus Paceibacterota bacterium]MBP9780795.1 hypothetical protein [Candidatus Paceibacterota bacterium]
MFEKIKKFIAPCVMLGAFVVGVSFASAQSATVELEGFAWSDNVGWISMNCKTGSMTASDICGVSNYKVTVGAGGALTGYGWSDNVGWVKFGGLSGIPGGGSNATYNATTGKVSGFVRFCSGISGSSYWNVNNSCSGSTRTDGWDGFVSLSSAINPIYGVTVASNGLFSGFAWGDEVVGWVDFSMVRLSSSTVNPSENVFLDVGAIPPGSLAPTYTPANLTSIPITPVTSPFTIQIAVTQGLYYKWNTAGANSCAIQGASNFPVQASMLQAGSSGTGVMLPIGTHYIAIVCQMTSGNTMIKAGTVNVVGVGVWINLDPNAVNTATQATLTYYSVGVQPNSCRAYSLDSSNYNITYSFPNGEFGPFGTGPGIQQSDPAKHLSVLIGATPGTPQTADWNPVNTVLQSAGGGQVSGSQVINRELSDARYYIECINPLNGDAIHSSVNTVAFELFPMDLTAYKNGVPVTQVNQGDTVDLEYKPQNMGYTLSTCVGSAINLANAQSVTVPNWNGPINPSYTPLNGTTPSSILGLATVLPAGSDIQYKVSCVTPWGAVATDTADIEILGASGAGLTLVASQSTYNASTPGQTVDLSWSDNQNAYTLNTKACTAGKVSPPTNTGMVIGGSSKNAANWTSVINLPSPETTFWSTSTQTDVGVPNAAPTAVTYWISCVDDLGVTHEASTTITLTTLPGPTLGQTINARCLPDDISATEFEVWWESVPSTNTCYSTNSTTNTLIPWSSGTHGDGLPPLGNVFGYIGVDEGSFVYDYSLIPPQGFTVTMQCLDVGGLPLTGTVSATIFPDCSVQTSSAGPKKPRFEEF